MPSKATKDVLEKCMDFSCLLNTLVSRHGGGDYKSLVASGLSPIRLDKPAYKNR